MSALTDPVEVLLAEQELDDFSALSSREVAQAPSLATALPAAATARFHGFDVSNRPLIAGLPGLPGELVAARATIRLLCAQIGLTVVVLFEQGDVRRPIVVGVLQEPRAVTETATVPPELVSVQADDDRLVLSAEREIVMKCGAASITLTRAGKVIIKGSYVISRSAGCNKIKGAVVDIN